MVSTGSYTETKLNLRGPLADLYHIPLLRDEDDGYLYDEILFWSLRGSGKSVGIADTEVRWCIDYPGTRILVLRSTLTRLKETFKTTLDRHVLPHYGLTASECYRSSEHKYVIGESEILLGGADDPERYRSFEGNVVHCPEATELSLAQYQAPIGSLRWPHGLPWHGRVNDVNPANPYNFIHQRFIGGKQNWRRRAHIEAKGRIAYRLTHADNPHYTNEDGSPTDAGVAYQRTLEQLTGVEYRRQVLAEWAAAQGALFADIDLEACLLRGAMLDKRDGFWHVDFPLDAERESIKLGWFSAGFDHGTSVPTSFTVWGHEANGDRKVLVAELYHTGWDEADLVPRIMDLEGRWGIWRGVGDYAAASAMLAINKRISQRTDGRPFLVNCTKASGTAGNEAYAQAMHMHAEMKHGNILYMPNTLVHAPDPVLLDRGDPTCAYEELPGLMFAPPQQSKKYEIVGGPPPQDELVKKNDHAFDGTRYMLRALSYHDLTPPPDQVKRKGPGDYGLEEAIYNDPLFQEIMEERGLV